MSQASRLDSYFGITDAGSTVRAEVVGGLTTGRGREFPVGLHVLAAILAVRWASSLVGWP